MSKSRRFSLIYLGILIISLVIVQNVTCLGQSDKPRPKPFDWGIEPEDVERLKATISIFFTVKTIINTGTSILILGLMIVHTGIYRRTGTKFSLGLVFFSTAFLLYTIWSNPLLYRLIPGFKRIGFGSILIIPDVFTLIASAVLLYLSQK